MTEQTLAQAVAAFAQATIGLTEEDLERPWIWRYHDEEGLRFALLGTYQELRDLATGTAATRAATGPPLTRAQRILGQYHHAYRDLQAVLLPVDETAALQEPAPGEWPIWMTLWHMMGAEQSFFPRILDGVARGRIRAPLRELPEPERLALLAADPQTDALRLVRLIYGPAIDSVAGNADAPDPDVPAASFGALVDYYDTLHARILRELAGLTDADLAAPALWWEEAAVPAEYRLHRFDAHLRQHTIQIEKTLAALGRLPSEAGRLLRHIYAALAEAENAVLGLADAAVPGGQDVAPTIAARAAEVTALLGRPAP